ncbi:hypothetical protein QR680_001634 [Steinernema hermaphroditum]|uniref:Serpin domain-containing protein n=1 Tax=Steinernema hermaphroditum TaxID=289476 RepID=A0AA39H0S0_9BILA|nr:hypothetical protein QR680_001634 [Steinernema hermaphroditum]
MAESRSHSMDVTQADFALHFLKRHPESVIVSPLSISTALAMVYAGSDGTTKDEIRQALAGDIADKEIHEYFMYVLKQAGKPSSDVILEIANKVYVQEGFKILKEYESLIEKEYDGNFQLTDFSDSFKSSKIVNSWVSQATHGKIQDLINPSMIDSMTRMVLVNAAYLKGSWKTKFDENRTISEQFYQSPDHEKEVRMMNIRGKYGYSKSETAEVLRLPYSDETFVMYIVLPQERYGLQSFVKATNGNDILALFDCCQTRTVQVKIPKFKIETSLELTDALKEAGIKNAFDASSADFSKMTGDRSLYVSDVVHKAFVEVDETGTEAAAATGAVMRLRCAAPSMPEEVVIFHANHGFLYFIVNTTSKGILFAGSFI